MAAGPGSEPRDRASYLLLRCAGCGSAVTAGPPPRFADAHGAGAYSPGAPRGATLAAPLLRAFHRRRLALLAGAPGRTLVDVGAGRGGFVATARAAGWDAHGLEPAARGAAPHVVRALLGAAVVPAASFDAIALWHVLEHVEDPAAALARLRGWLRPGGLLLIGVPNLDSLQARLGGPRWYHLDVPRRRTHFTARGIRALVDRSGLAAISTTHVLAEHNPFGMWQSLVSRATPTQSWLYHALERNARISAADALPTLLAAPLAPVAAALELAAGAAGHGGTVAVLARQRY